MAQRGKDDAERVELWIATAHWNLEGFGRIRLEKAGLSYDEAKMRAKDQEQQFLETIGFDAIAQSIKEVAHSFK